MMMDIRVIQTQRVQPHNATRIHAARRLIDGSSVRGVRDGGEAALDRGRRCVGEGHADVGGGDAALRVEHALPDRGVGLGEAGQDNGKDIWAEKDDGTHCFQCANYQQLTFAKIVTDMDKLAQHETVPDHLTIVCGGKVTDGLRQKTRSYSLSKGFSAVTIWSGPELEEKIRKQSPEILLRFFGGQAFP